MRKKDLFWLAGLLEGEGYFGIGTSPRVTVEMADRDVVERAAKAMGSPSLIEQPPRLPRRKAMWVASVSGERAISLMRAVFPLMGERRSERIQEILDIVAKRRAEPRGKLMPQWVLLCRELARRGVTQRALAKVCNVSFTAMSHAVSGRTWGWLR